MCILCGAGDDASDWYIYVHIFVPKAEFKVRFPDILIEHIKDNFVNFLIYFVVFSFDI